MLAALRISECRQMHVISEADYGQVNVSLQQKNLSI